MLTRMYLVVCETHALEVRYEVLRGKACQALFKLARGCLGGLAVDV
jgi:hypothetical protein